MGFCTPAGYVLFLRQTPIFEQMLIDDEFCFAKILVFQSQTPNSCADSRLDGILIQH